MFVDTSSEGAAAQGTIEHPRLTWLGPALCFFVGLLLAARPALLAARFGNDFAPALVVARGVGAALISVGAGSFAWPFFTTERARSLLQCTIAVSVYASLVWMLWDWHVDDAAITYAYSENFARGLGLVLNPRHAPEEAYSSTLWMLLLAGARAFGLDVAFASKLMSTVVGFMLVSLVVITARRVLGRPLSGPAYAVTLSALTSTPLLVWSSSGLEHGLQALVLVSFVWAATDPERTVNRCAVGASALVLIRPEAPLVIAALGACLAVHAYLRERTPRSVLRTWPLVVLPCATLGGLLVFRYRYFHDLWPNPYYVKVVGTATFLRIVSPFGAGWRYVVEWLAQGGGFVLLVPLLLVRWQKLPLPIVVALSVLSGQLAFVLYAGGDWMPFWRFLAAPLALLALLAGYLVDRMAIEGALWAGRYARFAVAALFLCNVPLLVTFRAHPTTPYRTVATIGDTFVELAQKLSIENPLLAHHDAGGTSYRTRIDLLDLGGLGNRVIAKHFHDAEFLRRYILEERRPDFIFGTLEHFAAATAELPQAPLFQQDYVKLEVPSRSYMKADLCHVRRDRVRQVEGLRVDRAPDGSEVVVVDLPSKPLDGRFTR